MLTFSFNKLSTTILGHHIGLMALLSLNDQIVKEDVSLKHTEATTKVSFYDMGNIGIGELMMPFYLMKARLTMAATQPAVCLRHLHSFEVQFHTFLRRLGL